MNVHPTRAVETFNNQVALLKKQIYVKSVQAIACNSLKDETKWIDDSCRLQRKLW